jgi:hypothetical protein
MRYLLLTLLFIAPPVSPISIRVDKLVFYAGQDIVVTCVVPRHEDNRKVEAILPEFTGSEKQLNGDSQDRIYNTFVFKRVPSDVTSAVCQLTDKYNHHARASQTLQVIAPQ